MKKKINLNLILTWGGLTKVLVMIVQKYLFLKFENLTSQEIFDEIMQIEYENTTVRAVNVDQNTLYKGIFQNSNSIISTILWLFILNIISLIYLPILWKFFD